jgi:hypothetical protein
MNRTRRGPIEQKRPRSKTKPKISTAICGGIVGGAIAGVAGVPLFGCVVIGAGVAGVMLAITKK